MNDKTDHLSIVPPCDNVEVLRVTTSLNLDADRVLKAALGEMTECVIVGFDKDGGEYFASSVSDGGSTLWHLERAKLKLLKIADDK